MESFGNISFNNEKHEITPENTFVFHHLGKLALYDHIFIALLEEQGGAYIWNDDENYPSLLDYCEAGDAVIHSNLRSVADCDQEAFMRHHTQDIDTIPDDWA